MHVDILKNPTLIQVSHNPPLSPLRALQTLRALLLYKPILPILVDSWSVWTHQFNPKRVPKSPPFYCIIFLVVWRYGTFTSLCFPPLSVLINLFIPQRLEVLQVHRQQRARARWAAVGAHALHAVPLGLIWANTVQTGQKNERESGIMFTMFTILVQHVIFTCWPMGMQLVLQVFGHKPKCWTKIWPDDGATWKAKAADFYILHIKFSLLVFCSGGSFMKFEKISSVYLSLRLNIVNRNPVLQAELKEVGI